MISAKPKRVTIKTIAQQVGVTHQTVSNVLNGQAKERRISDITAKRIRDVANRLGYVPNSWARNLVTQRSGTISTLFHSLSMDWAQSVMEGVHPVLADRHYTPLIGVYANSKEPLLPISEADSDVIDKILQRQDEGVLCQPIIGLRNGYHKLIQNSIPTVFMSGLFEDMSNLDAMSSVTWDCGPSVKMLVQHLVSTGRRKIAFIGTRHLLQSDQIRYNAFREALDEAGLPFVEDWEVWGSVYQMPTYEQIATMIYQPNERPDAFFVLNDGIAIGVLRILELMGLKVPDDIAVVGMGDLPAANFVGLTTVREPLSKIGQEAAEIILDMIDNPQKKSVHRRLRCNEIQIRRSTKG